MSIHDLTREERLAQTLADWDALPQIERDKRVRAILETNLRLQEIMIPFVENNGITAYRDAVAALVKTTDKVARKADKAIKRARRLENKLRRKIADLGQEELQAVLDEEEADESDLAAQALDAYARLPPLPGLDPPVSLKLDP